MSSFKIKKALFFSSDILHHTPRQSVVKGHFGERPKMEKLKLELFGYLEDTQYPELRDLVSCPLPSYKGSHLERLTCPRSHS